METKINITREDIRKIIVEKPIEKINGRIKWSSKNYNMENKDFEAFSSKYQTTEKEILVLTPDKSGGAVKFYNSWDCIQYFLAYIDLTSNELKNGEGRIRWLISDDEGNKNGISFPYYFKNGTAYRLKVRELLDKTVTEGRSPSFYNCFMVVEVIEEDVKDEKLLAILEDYRKPVKITDEQLGEFELNKDYGTFSGKIKWNEKDISVSLEVDMEDKTTWAKTLDILLELYNQQQKYDVEFRTFSSKQLTDLANDWLEEDNSAITETDFFNRINLSELVVTFEGNYTAYYDDDDMFYGHIIDVSGNIQTGLKSANIAG